MQVGKYHDLHVPESDHQWPILSHKKQQVVRTSVDAKHDVKTAIKKINEDIMTPRKL